MRHHTPAALLVTLVFAGIGGCSVGPRPDAEVAAAVEREERRLADERGRERAARAASALASAGGALAEIASVDVAAGGLLWGPLYVPSTHSGASPRNLAQHHVLPPEPPQGWPHVERFYSALVLEEAMAADGEVDDEQVVSDDGPGKRRKSGNGKPKIRVDLLRLRMNGNPVSFSGSLKGFKGVQLKATIKM